MDEKPILVVFGEPGIGKTTFGSSAPDCIFIAAERGAKRVDCRRFPENGYCRTWSEFLGQLKKVANGGAGGAQWLVIDTISNVENLLAQEVCEKKFDGNWLSGQGEQGFNAYGRGAKLVAQEFRQVNTYLERINDDLGMGIILLSHVGLHRASNMLGPDYQRLAPRMDKASWGVLEEHVDIVGYAGTEVRASIRTGENKAKASLVGDTRWLWFGKHPGRVSKDRAGFVMPDKILFDWDTFYSALSADPISALTEEALELLKEASKEDRQKVQERAGGDIGKDAISRIGKRKLEQLIGWLKSRQPQDAE